MLEPYFQNDQATIYNQDCLPVLSQLENQSVDTVLTDPPYCSGGFLESQKNTNGQGIRSQNKNRDDYKWFSADNMTTPGLVFLLRAVLMEARRFMKPNRSAFIFTDWRMVPNITPPLESGGMRYRNMIVWDKGNAGLGKGFRPQHEILLEFANGSTEYQKANGSNVIKCPRVPTAKRKHNAEKPTELLKKVIGIAAPEGGLVCDPFMGCGSVLEAAVLMKCRYIGCELDEQYCEAAAKRLEQGVLF